MAAAKADERGSIQAALREMKSKRLGAYKHAGVELSFVAGEDKLRVRLTNDNEDSAATLEGGEGDEAPEAGEGEAEAPETDEGAGE